MLPGGVTNQQMIEAIAEGARSARMDRGGAET